MMHAPARIRTHQAIAIAIVVVVSMVCGSGVALLQQATFVPHWMFPLLLPVLLGFVIGGVCAVQGRATAWPLPGLLAIAVIAACLAVFVENYVSYLAYTSNIDATLDRNPKAALARSLGGFKPADFPHFVATLIRSSGGWWYVDATVTIAASVLAGWLFARPESTGALNTHPSN